MGWETRRGGRYYYTHRRRGRKVIKVYHGHGVLGELAAFAVEQVRRRRAERAEVLRSELARLDRPESALVALDEASRLMVEASLTVAGFHCHRSTWRRRHVRSEEPDMAGTGGRG